MSVLTDLSVQAMAAANEANLYSSSPFPYDLPGSEAYGGNDVCWCITGIPLLPCNIVFKARLRPERVNSTIETLVERAGARNVTLRWMIGKDTEPVDLGEHLLAHGFAASGSGPLMAIDLHCLQREAPLPAGVTVSEIKNDDDFEAWCRIVAECFGIPSERAPALSRWFKIVMGLKLPVHFYLAFRDGEPVGTSQLFSAEGVAGIYYVGTVPKARNQGIGYAVTRRALQAGLDMGYRVGTLQASKMGEPVYLKMGFTEVGRITSYLWRKPQ